MDEKKALTKKDLLLAGTWVGFTYMVGAVVMLGVNRGLEMAHQMYEQRKK